MLRLVVLSFLWSFLFPYSFSFSFHFLSKKCPPEKFQCQNGQCIPLGDLCDYFVDCRDGSDEEHCPHDEFGNKMPFPNFIPPPKPEYISTIICDKTEYQCKESKECIPLPKFCDSVKDCIDGSDEYDNCVLNLNCTNKFRCNDQHCIFNEWVCDGLGDCPDLSDELNCSANKTSSANNCKTEKSQYLCGNQRCIPFSAVCDKKNDCGDGSDEGAGCSPSTCPSAKCEHECKQTPKGSVCTCKPGYKLQDNNRTCEDIDECQIYGICDQQCMNSVGSYSCKCKRNYFLQDDKKTCKAQAGEGTLVFSTKTEIIGMYVDSKVNFTLASKLNRATSVTMNGREHIYWSDIEKGTESETIVRSIPGNSHEVIVTTGLSMISGIAVDWVTENIYFTDEDYNRIGVCNNNGTQCTVLINGLDKPTGITLLPSNGKMFWSEGGINPRIAVAGMDGKNIRTLVSKDLEWPRSITIDYPNQRLYWVDSKLKLVESIRLADGSDRRLILHDVIQEPFSLAVFENTLYWSDSGSNTIQSCNKFSGKDWHILYRTHDKPYGIHIDHSVVKPKIDNPCQFNQCSELCLLNQNKRYTCACTLDKKLNADYHTCNELKENQHLLIVTQKKFVNYYHGLLGKPKVTNVSNLELYQVVSDPSSGQVIISSRKIRWSMESDLKRYDPVNNTFKNITTTNLLDEMSDGIAFDYIGNNLYISNPFDKSIEVFNERTLAKTVFHFEHKPTSIALAPEERKMFVTVRKGYLSRSLYEMRMDGLGERKLLKVDLIGPKISTYYDRDSKTLFVADEGSGSILSNSIYSNEGMRVLRTGLNMPYCLTVAGDNIFWTEILSDTLYWTNFKNTFSNHKAVALNHVHNNYSPFFGFLRVVTLRKDAKQEHDCQKNNGNCSHVCLPSINSSFICACPPRMDLSNNRKCILSSPCPKNKYKCNRHDICIEKEKLCDGIVHCPDGDDETGNCKGKRCKEGQFTCKDGECISSKKHCDSHFDCTDQSDEEDCENPTCKSDEFRCHDGTCIPKIDVCNIHADCPDHSDEINCTSHFCSKDEFKCDGNKCIPKIFVCDDELDCMDGKDEADDICTIVTNVTQSCLDGYFQCTDGECISLLLRCDGIDDCFDKSDERDCLNKPDHLVNCTLNQYHCVNTDLCLPKNVRCDGQNDCPERDDEHDCSFCFKNEFTCDNKQCIPDDWVCDKTDDCGDGSDEKNCNGAKEIKFNEFNNCDEFKCSVGTCLPYSKVCDGTRDCPDGSDEDGKCQSACTMINFCKDVCYKTPTGPICGCPNGYRLASDAISCEDINECEQNVCSQICYNTPGSYQCSCHDGYIIRNDKVSCKAAGPAMKLIIVTDTDIRLISLSNLHTLSIQVLYSLADSSLNSLDINMIQNSVYWSNDKFGYIKKYNIKTKKLINTMIVEHPKLLAVDWITDNVYVIDNGRPNTIKVCDLEKQRCATLVKIEDNAKAISLAVDPINKWLFWVQITWTQINQPLTKICRADMTGADIKIINSHGGIVTGMAIDYIKSKLYWLDNFHKTIEFSNLDGSQHTMFLNTSIHHPSDISIFEQTLWIIDFNGLQLLSCKLYGAKKSCETTHSGINNVYMFKHFTILHPSRQPSGKNPCDEEHCDYMCIQKKDNATCVCSDGKPIKSNSICTINANESKFAKNTSSRNARHMSGIYSVTIVILLVGVVLLCVYYYYQRNKLKLKSVNDLSSRSIRFQNPSYDRSDEVEVVLNSVASDLAPGQHEYVNPIDDKFFKPTMECYMHKSNQCSEEKDVEETKKENALIYLEHTK